MATTVLRPACAGLFALILLACCPLQAQNVGIGTATPGAKLEIFGGTVRIDDGAGGDYTFPPADGAAGEVLVTDGNGVVTWQPLSVSSLWTEGTGSPNGGSFSADFNSGFPAGWSRLNTFNIEVTGMGGTSPDCAGSPNAVMMSGFNGNFFESPSINAAGCASVNIQFDWREGRDSDCENTNDDGIFEVQYFDGFNWQPVQSFSHAQDQTSFTTENLSVSTSLTSQFKIRFFTTAGDGNNGLSAFIDGFAIDNVSVSTSGCTGETYAYPVTPPISVNQTSAPGQAIDVNGWVELGDENSTPGMGTEGAIRYNSATQNIELHNGTNWIPAAADGDWVDDANGVTNTGVNVGIGTATPTERLEISGNLEYGASFGHRLYVQPAVSGAGDNLRIEGGAAGGANNGGGGLVLIPGVGNANNGSTRIDAGITGSNFGNILFSPNDVAQVGIQDANPLYALEMPNIDNFNNGRPRAFAWETYSSRRWKRNIEPLADGTGYLERLRPVEFDWQESSGGQHATGFIAEEVNDVMPWAVSMSAGGQHAEGMDYAQMTPILVRSIQQQQDDIRELQNGIQSLQTRLEAAKAALRRQQSSRSAAAPEQPGEQVKPGQNNLPLPTH